MLPESLQKEILLRIASAARKYGLLVAPIGSVYFLFRGRPKLFSKDVDGVILDEKGEPASLEMLRRIGEELGDVKVGQDRASVTVTIHGEGEAIFIDLLRGKEGAGGGFLPRGLLREAMTKSTTEGNLVWFPSEYVIVLKADAAIDRENRARSRNPHSEDNERRAAAFRQDVFDQMTAGLKEGSFSKKEFVSALDHLKQNRKKPVARLLEAASAGTFAFDF